MLAREMSYNFWLYLLFKFIASLPGVIPVGCPDQQQTRVSVDRSDSTPLSTTTSYRLDDGGEVCLHVPDEVLLQPATLPRLNGSFFVVGLDQTLFHVTHLTAACIPSTVGESCDQVLIDRQMTPLQRGFLWVTYIPDGGGAEVCAIVSYGPSGITFAGDVLVEEPVFVPDDGSIVFEARGTLPNSFTEAVCEWDGVNFVQSTLLPVLAAPVMGCAEAITSTGTSTSLLTLTVSLDQERPEGVELTPRQIVVALLPDGDDCSLLLSDLSVPRSQPLNVTGIPPVTMELDMEATTGDSAGDATSTSGGAGNQEETTALNTALTVSTSTTLSTIAQTPSAHGTPPIIAAVTLSVVFVLVILIALVIVLVIVLFCHKKKKNSKSNKDDIEYGHTKLNNSLQKRESQKDLVDGLKSAALPSLQVCRDQNINVESAPDTPNSRGSFTTSEASTTSIILQATNKMMEGLTDLKKNQEESFNEIKQQGKDIKEIAEYSSRHLDDRALCNNSS